MAKKKRTRADHRQEPRRPKIVRREVPRAAGDAEAEAQPFLQVIKRALYGGPVPFLDTMSGILASLEPQPLGPPAQTTIDQLVESFEGVDVAATTAALHAIATLSSDEVLARRIRRTLATRRQPMPRWLTELASTTIAQVVELRHVQRDGEDYFLDVRLPDRYAMTVMVYVDNNMGQIVKEAYTIDLAWSDVQQTMGDDLLGDVPEDNRLGPFDPAEARAIIEQALAHGAMTLGAPETETWPLCRPLVRWLVGLLPGGFELPEWSERTDEEAAAFVEAFLASRWGSGFDDDAHRDLLDSLHWWGSGSGTGDPLRWSPVGVEIVLSDIAPRKFDAEPDELDRLPPLLKALIRHAHHERGIGAHLTKETIDAVDHWTPEFRRRVHSEVDTAPYARATAIARALLDVEVRDPRDPEVDAVGGPEELGALTPEPLPDEPFDWTVVPDDVRDKVAEILRLCDDAADELLDVEHRTAQRRLLRDVVAADPGYFRGRAATKGHAAAICYLVAHANETVGGYDGPLTVRELLEPVGGGQPNDRADRFRAMLGLPPKRYDGALEPISLGSAEYLVGERRADIIQIRDALA